MAVMGTPNAVPAVCVPGFATLNVLAPAGLTVKVPVEPVTEPTLTVRFVEAEAL